MGSITYLLQFHKYAEANKPFKLPLLKHKNENTINETAILRIEQYYPFNEELLLKMLSKYSKVEKIYWVQEEPQNMGAWFFIFQRLYNKLPKNILLEYVGRKESPSPASGSNKEFLQFHCLQPETLVIFDDMSNKIQYRKLSHVMSYVPILLFIFTHLVLWL